MSIANECLCPGWYQNASAPVKIEEQHQVLSQKDWALYLIEQEVVMAVELDKLPKEERLERLRHSASHIMAEAVLAMFPDAKLAIGPPIATGFSYDFDLPRPLTMDDLQGIEERMRERIVR